MNVITVVKWFIAALAVFAACQLLNAGYEEWTGEAVISGGRGKVEKATREGNPAAFRNFMNYQWAIASLWAGAALLIWRIVRKQEALSEFPPGPPEESSRQK